MNTKKNSHASIVTTLDVTVITVHREQIVLNAEPTSKTYTPIFLHAWPCALAVPPSLMQSNKIYFWVLCVWFVLFIQFPLLTSFFLRIARFYVWSNELDGFD